VGVTKLRPGLYRAYPLFLESPRSQFFTLAPNVFWSRNCAVMAQKVILSPHSQTRKLDPRFSPFAADSINSWLAIVFLQLGQVI
jgi:hypothetical protein